LGQKSERVYIALRAIPDHVANVNEKILNYFLRKSGAQAHLICGQIRGIKNILRWHLKSDLGFQQTFY
jgi:hypothetical protein